MKINHPTQDYTRWNLPEGAKTRLGKGIINDIQFSPDGNRFVVVSSIGIWIYDAHTGKELHLLVRNKIDFHSTAFSIDSYPLTGVNSVTFSPDGCTLATIGGRDQKIHLWDVTTGMLLQTLTTGGSVSFIVFSPDGRTLASNGFQEIPTRSIVDGSSTIHLWDVVTGECLKILTRVNGGASSMAFSPDGNMIAIAGGFRLKSINLWDVSSGESVKTLAGHTERISSIAFIPDSNILVSRSADKTSHLWDITTGKLLKTFTGRTQEVISEIFNPFGLTQSVNLGEMIHPLSILRASTEHIGSVSSVAFSPDGGTLASANLDGKIYLWNIVSDLSFKTLVGHAGGINSIAFSPDGRTLASGGENGMIYLWDIGTGAHLGSGCHRGAGVNSIAFSPDGRTLASGDREMRIYLWDIATPHFHKALIPYKTLIGHEGSINSVAFSADGRVLASSSEDKTVRQWNVVSGEQHKHLLTEHSVNSVAVFTTPDGCSFRYTKEGVQCLAVSPDGKTLASTERNEVNLWDVVSGKHKQTLKGHTGNVASVAFNIDGKTLASGSDDGTILLWNIKWHRSSHLLRLEAGRITLASECEDGPALLWDVHSSNEVTPPDDNPFNIPKLKTDNSSDKTSVRSISQLQLSLLNTDNSSDETVLTEEDFEFQNRESQIQQICEERGITTLVHFTRIENLQSILREGLLGRKTLEKRLQEGLLKLPKLFINDHSRWDKHKEAVCLSISFPNYLMFSSIRKQKVMSDGISDSGWVVLVLDAKVLWELDCVFCTENAASNAVRHDPLNVRRKPEVLEGMFVDTYRDTKGNVYQRQSLQIPDDYPTHPQAEILVFDQIPSDYIKEVHFYDETTLKQWCDNNPWINPERLLHNQQYFQYGRDQVVWQDDNLDDIPPAPPPEDDNLDDVIPF